jgi:hypothetical protein
MPAAPKQSHAEDEVVRVADMLDDIAAGDVTLTISGLEDLVSRLRTAATARAVLADVDRDTLMAALVLRRQRAADGTTRR